MNKTILVFEDESHVVQCLIEVFVAAIGPAGSLKVVHFNGRFDPPGQNKIYPISVEDEDAFRPDVYDICGGEVKDFKEKSEWWQSEFDAAILDVFNEATLEEVGYNYIDWLARAEFTGPVSVISRRARQVNRSGGL